MDKIFLEVKSAKKARKQSGMDFVLKVCGGYMCFRFYSELLEFRGQK